MLTLHFCEAIVPKEYDLLTLDKLTPKNRIKYLVLVFLSQIEVKQPSIL
jgi:hypothetical protein